MQLQLTALTSIVGIIIMLGAWLYVGRRMKQSQTATIRTVQLLRSYFLYMVAFFAIMAAPYLVLSVDPSKFPVYMAWGYVVGHIFLYLSFIDIARMITTIVPKLASKEKLAVIVGAIFTAGITVVNAITMIWGTQPVYNFERHLTQYNASPIVGAAIGLSAMLTIFPAAVLFFVSAVKNPARRIRSLLLGSGFLIITIAGPLHDVAKTWQFYMAADIFTILGMVIMGIGVAYRYEQSLVLEAKPASVPPVVPSSNTV